MPMIVANNLKFHYKDYPPENSVYGKEVTPLVFLHGFTLDCRMWYPQADFFKKDYRVVLMDARGHGLTEAPLSGYGRADRVEDLRDFLEAMKITKMHLIGLSMGGSTAIGFALKYEEYLKSLTLVSSGAAGYNIGGKISALDRIAKEQGLEAVKKRWKEMSLAWYGDDQKETRDWLEKMMDEHSGAVWMDPMRGLYPRTVDLDHVSAIKAPTAIFAGAEDTVFLRLAKDLRERIAGSVLRVYEGVGHMVNLEVAERFNVDLKGFIDKAEVRK